MNQPVNAEILHGMVKFVRTYLDWCHHGREEDLLFTVMFKNGVPIHGRPIEASTLEHVKGRSLVKGLAKSC